MKKKRSMILGLMIVTSLLVTIGCDLSGSSDDGGGGTPEETYAIGDTGPSGVGIVFYVTDGGLHGLEVAPSLWKGGTEDPTGQWKNENTTTSGTLTAIGTGSANTAAMAGVEHPAAELCRTYTGGGKTDWFLPSKDELKAIWDNLVDNGSGDNNGVGAFAEEEYWSSSEDGKFVAWLHGFSDGYQGHGQKIDDSFRVRAVRAF